MASKRYRRASSSLREEDKLLQDWVAGRYGPNSGRGLKGQRTGIWYMCVALGLIGTGCYILYKNSFSPMRSALEKDYEQELQAWESGSRKAFEATSWSIRFNETEIPLVANITEDALSHRNFPPHRKVVFTLRRLYDHLLPPEEIDRLETGEIRLEAAGLVPRAADLPQPGEEEEEENEENEDGDEGGQTAGRGATVRISRSARGPELAAVEGFAGKPKGPGAVKALEALRSIDLTLVARGPSGREEAILPLGPTPVVRKLVRSSANWKNCKYRLRGIQMPGKSCLIVEAIQGICVKIRSIGTDGQEAGAPRWQLARGDGGSAAAGCRSSKQPPVTYGTIKRPGLGRSNWNATANRPLLIPPAIVKSASLTIRSDADPELRMADLLRKYDMTAMHTKESVSALGTIFLVIGGVIFVPAVMFLAPESMSPFGRISRQEADEETIL